MLFLSRGCWYKYRRSAFLCIQKVAKEDMSVARPGPEPDPSRAGARVVTAGYSKPAAVCQCLLVQASLASETPPLHTQKTVTVTVGTPGRGALRPGTELRVARGFNLKPVMKPECQLKRSL